MSTRGLLGFVLDSKPYLTYNHSDSYPGWLGVRAAEFVIASNINEVRTMVAGLTVVDEDDTPTPKQRAALPLHDRSDAGWYELLRNTQGDPEAILRSRFMIDNFAFGFDSLFCEWCYVIDLDAETLDVYNGFQNSPTTDGLWAGDALTEGEYTSVKRITSIPFAEVTTDAVVALDEVGE